MANYQLTRLVPPTSIQRLPRLRLMASIAAALLALAGCSEQSTELAADQAEHVQPEILSAQSLTTLQNLIAAQRRKSIIFAEALRLSTEQFLETPDDVRRTSLQEAWLKAHAAYADLANLPALALLPPNATKIANKLQYQIDAWPIEPGYLDSLPAYPASGIISDVTVPMTLASLQEQHGFTDLQEVSLGFHALEYLIFSRELTDFQLAGASLGQTQPDRLHSAPRNDIVSRRRNALRLIAEQISQDLTSLENIDAKDADGSVSDREPDATNAGLAPTVAVIKHLREITLQILDDNQRLIRGDVGHGEYSATNQQLMGAQLESLQLILFGPVKLTTLVRADETNTVENLDNTLQEARAIASGETITAEKHARLAILLAALPHLLDDLAQRLGLPEG